MFLRKQFPFREMKGEFFARAPREVITARWKDRATLSHVL